MAHFAEIDENNVVARVLVVSNEHEEDGQNYLSNELGFGGTWIQTSYNNKFRHKFASIGDIYDESDDTFKPAQNYPSWIWDSDAWSWQPPVPHPNDGEWYLWNEADLSWELIAE